MSLFCPSISNNLSSRDRSISLCECTNGTSYSSKFNENDEVEQDTVELEEKTKYPLWERIHQESKDNMAVYVQWWKDTFFQETTPFFQEEPSDYLNKNIFPLLLPVLKDMLIQAFQKPGGIQNDNFNGIDFLAENLWNQNPRHPERLVNGLDILNTPSFKSV